MALDVDVKVSLSQFTYERVKQWAVIQQQDVETTIAEYLDNSLPSLDTLPIPPAEPDPAVERERSAYLRLYPQLQKTHAGDHVAIYGGQLVDFDTDEAALFARIDDKYPDEFVWLARVDDPPEREIKLRSPRFVADSP